MVSALICDILTENIDLELTYTDQGGLSMREIQALCLPSERDPLPVIFIRRKSLKPVDTSQFQ